VTKHNSNESTAISLLSVINVTCEEYAKCKTMDMFYVQRMQDTITQAGRFRVFIGKALA